MIAADRLTVFAHRSAAEFPAPNDKGVFQHSPLFEIKDEGGAGLIYIFADLFEVLVEVLAGSTVAVPVSVIELHKAGAAFDETASEEAVGSER